MSDDYRALVHHIKSPHTISHQSDLHQSRKISFQKDSKITRMVQKEINFFEYQNKRVRHLLKEIVTTETKPHKASWYYIYIYIYEYILSSDTKLICKKL